MRCLLDAMSAAGLAGCRKRQGVHTRTGRTREKVERDYARIKGGVAGQGSAMCRATTETKGSSEDCAADSDKAGLAAMGDDYCAAVGRGIPQRLS